MFFILFCPHHTSSDIPSCEEPPSLRRVKRYFSFFHYTTPAPLQAGPSCSLYGVDAESAVGTKKSAQEWWPGQVPGGELALTWMP